MDNNMNNNNIASPVGTHVKPPTPTTAVDDDDDGVVSNPGQDSENQAPVARLFSPSRNILGDKLLSPYSTSKNKNEKMEISAPARQRQATCSSNDDDAVSNHRAGQDTGNHDPVETIFSPPTASRTTLGDNILSPTYSAKQEQEQNNAGAAVPAKTDCVDMSLGEAQAFWKNKMSFVLMDVDVEFLGETLLGWIALNMDRHGDQGGAAVPDSVQQDSSV